MLGISLTVAMFAGATGATGPDAYAGHQRVFWLMLVTGLAVVAIAWPLCGPMPLNSTRRHITADEHLRDQARAWPPSPPTPTSDDDVGVRSTVAADLAAHAEHGSEQ